MKFTDHDWTEIFNIKEDIFTAWQEEKASDSFILWALDNDHLDSAAYLEWAKNHYQTPVIQDAFLEAHPMSQEKWKRVKDLETWTKEFAPIWEAENTLYIACLIPPKKDKKSYRYVIASPDFLKAHWKRVNSFDDLKVAPENLKASTLPEPEPIRIAPNEVDEPQRTVQEEPVLELKTATDKKEIGTSTLLHKLKKTSSDSEGDPEEYFKKLEPFFLNSVILNVEATSFIPIDGRNFKLKKNQPIVCEAKSFLQVCKRGHIYNGFIIAHDVNKNFFMNLGYSSFPKYAVAIPIKNKAEKVEKIILGLSKKLLSETEVNKIEAISYDYFDQTKKATDKAL